MDWFLGLTDVCRLGPTCRLDWEAWAAIGTVFAATIALGLGVRDLFSRMLDRHARAKMAAIMIQPELRRYLMGLKMLKVGPAVREWPWAEDRHLEVQRTVGSLQSDNDRVLLLGHDLPGRQSLQFARALSSVRHAVRHTHDLMVRGTTLSNKRVKSKQATIKTACTRGHNDVVKLLNYCRRVRDESLRNDAPLWKRLFERSVANKAKIS